jgi:hypothetical protein
MRAHQEDVERGGAGVNRARQEKVSCGSSLAVHGLIEVELRTFLRFPEEVLHPLAVGLAESGHRYSFPFLRREFLFPRRSRRVENVCGVSLGVCGFWAEDLPHTTPAL